MITKNRQQISIVAGETDTVLQDGAFNDSADAPTGNTVISGTFFMPDGTQGALLMLNISSVGAPAGVITQIEIQAGAAGQFVTIGTIANLQINAVGLYAFEVQPAAQQANYAGFLQIAMPNQGRIKLTMTNRTDSINGSLSLQSTW